MTNNERPLTSSLVGRNPGGPETGSGASESELEDDSDSDSDDTEGGAEGGRTKLTSEQLDHARQAINDVWITQKAHKEELRAHGKNWPLSLNTRN